MARSHPVLTNSTTPGAPLAPRRRPIVWRNAAFLILLPLVTAIVVPWTVLTVGVSWIDIAACVGLWFLIGLSVTAGYHRLFTHRAYAASAPIRAIFAIFGAAAMENSIIAWAAAHRYHHRHVDSDDDPYNPQQGFWYSHMGWVMVEGPKHDDTSNVPDLWKDPICVWQHRHYLAISIGVNVAMTVLLGLVTGRWAGMIAFSLLLRMVLTHHFTFLINSAAHMWGSQPWSAGHSARDNWALSFLTFGEGYHNYHHTFQADYRNGPLWYNWDPTKWLIWTLARLRLAGELRRSPVDVRLDRLFSEARRRFHDRLASLGHTAEGWRERAVTAGGEAGHALREQFEAAERRVEEALAELQAVRTRWQAAAADRTRARAEHVTLRRRLAESRRLAQRAMRRWREASGAYLQYAVTA